MGCPHLLLSRHFCFSPFFPLSGFYSMLLSALLYFLFLFTPPLLFFFSCPAVLSAALLFLSFKFSNEKPPVISCMFLRSFQGLRCSRFTLTLCVLIIAGINNIFCLPFDQYNRCAQQFNRIECTSINEKVFMVFI